MTIHAGIFDVLDIRPGRRWARSDAWLWMQGQTDAAGCLTTSLREMCEAFGWPRTSLRRFLADLEAAGLIKMAGSGQAERTITLCHAYKNQAQHKRAGHRIGVSEPRQTPIRAPSSPDKRAAFFAAMVNGPDPMPEGALSPLMAEALLIGGMVTVEALRRKGVQA